MAKDAKAKRAASLVNPTAATAFKQNDDATKAAAVEIPQGAHSFYVRAKGTATGGTTVNFTPKIQVCLLAQASDFVTAATAANNVDFFSGGAAAYNTASGPWILEVLCAYDSVNKLLSGVGWGVNGSGGAAVATVAATQVTTSTLASLDINGAAGSCGFAATALFSASNAGNKAFLDDLSVEVYAIWER